VSGEVRHSGLENALMNLVDEIEEYALLCIERKISCSPLTLLGKIKKVKKS
jgi:hypothetical protein